MRLKAYFTFLLSNHTTSNKPCTLYTVQHTVYTLYSIQCIHYTLYTVHWSLYSVHCILFIYSVYYSCTLYTIHCTRVQCTLYCNLQQVISEFRIIYTVHCILYTVQWKITCKSRATYVITPSNERLPRDLYTRDPIIHYKKHASEVVRSQASNYSRLWLHRRYTLYSVSQD